MKKRIRKRPPDEIKVVEKKRLDEMEHEVTEKQKSWFKRKPYQMRDKNERV